jgi:hypothetical protein
MTRHFRPSRCDVPIFHSNSRYAAESACENCDSVGGRHLPWCVAVNDNVLYAYSVILKSETMTEHDRCILHALGVLWNPSCKCNPVAGTPLGHTP